ncbi:AAA family ATPase [Melittangium boletus]|uniref:AAA family ATPase n=1 Tax=Melittangium boletus TaxID=83453 RepID=UPI003DA4DD7D
MRGGLRIDVLRIQGFGHFTNAEWELRPGLNLLYGPNEAGKSTLLAFLRGMLFGFDARYEPESGSWGGELCVSSAAGPLVIRRAASRRGKTLSVSSPEGLSLSESVLAEARAQVSAELFNEVFAFSLDELSSFERLAKEDGVSRALFAAGLRGARRLPEVEKALEKRTGELFKKGGRKPRLNEVLLRLETVRGQLAALEDRPARYLEERARLLSLGRELEDTRGTLELTQRELRRLARLEEALGDLGALARLQHELAGLPDLATFPRDGVVRLEELLQRRKDAHAARDRARAQRELAEREAARLSEVSPVDARQDALRAALTAFTARAEPLRTLPGRRVALEARREEVLRALEGLGLELDADDVRSLELGAAARGQLESLAERLTRAEGERHEAEGVLERARAARERLASGLSRLQGERGKPPALSPAEVRQRQMALGRARLLRMEREQVLSQRADLQQRLQALRAQAEPPLGAAPTSVWVGVAVGLALVGALGVGVASGVGPGLLTLLGALALVVPMVLLHRGALAHHQHQAEAQDVRQRHHAQEIARVQSALDALAGRRAAVERELAGTMGEAGVTGDDSVTGFASVEAALAEALRQAERAEHLAHEREAREAEHDGALQDVQAAELASRRADMRVRSLRGDLSLLLDARGLPANLAPQRAVSLWRDVAELRRRLVDLDAEGRALAEDTAGCEAVVSRLLAEARDAGLGEDEASAEAVASRVAAALEERKARDAEARALRARAEELHAEDARLSRLHEAEAQSVASLLAQGGGTRRSPSACAPGRPSASRS